MGRQQEIPDRRRTVAALDDVGDCVGVAERLGHLLVVDEQILNAHPEARELPAGRRFALRDLVLVMREDQIDAAGVDVNRRFPEQPQGHRRAFKMPPGPPGRIDEVPGRLAVPGALPQHEITRILFRVVVGVDARPRLHPLVIEARQTAVRRHGRNLEVDRAVAPVGVAVGVECGHQVRHRAQVRLIGRAWHLFDVLQPERAGILPIGRDVLIGIGPEIHAGLLRTGDRPIVDVGEVHDVPHLETEQMPQRSPEHVDADKGPEIPDVTSRVDRQAAGVHPHGAVPRRFEHLFCAAQRVIQTHGVTWEVKRMESKEVKASRCAEVTM